MSLYPKHASAPVDALVVEPLMGFCPTCGRMHPIRHRNIAPNELAVAARANAIAFNALFDGPAHEDSNDSKFWCPDNRVSPAQRGRRRTREERGPNSDGPGWAHRIFDSPLLRMLGRTSK